MFLHSGASLHGHEYSSRPTHPYPPGPRRSPLLRSALASANSSANSSTANSSVNSSVHSSATSSSSTPSNHSSYNSSYCPSFYSPATTIPSSSPSPVSIFRSSSVAGRASPAHVLRPKPHQRHISDGYFHPPRLPEPVVRFQDPVVAEPPPPPPPLTPQPFVSRAPTPSQTPRPAIRAPEPMSEDEASFSASEVSYMSDQGGGGASLAPSRRRRRSPRKSTTYLFAHPAPKLRTKKQLLRHLRPTLLMQLQQLSQEHRPLPAIDVYPASLIGGNVAPPRFSKLPRLFGLHGELGLHDTVLLRSEHYDAQSPSSESDVEDDVLEPRALLAVLSPLRREARSEIVLEDGTVWMATPLSNGSFDFVRVDRFGRTTKARWVRRTVTRPASLIQSPDGSVDPSSAEPCSKFTFSIIDPESRRHPILATLTKNTLDILDRYTTVSQSSGRYPPSRSWTRSPGPADGEESNEEDVPEEKEGARPLAPSALPHDKGRTTLPVDGALKDLICITGIWVLMQLGWAQLPSGSCLGGALNSPSTSTLRSVSGSFRRQPSPAIDGSQLEQLTGDMGSGVECRSRRLLSLRKPQANHLEGDESGAASIKGPTRATTVPPASSTGAAFVRRRKQLQQMSDTSDSERMSIRRPRTFSRLSGDFTKAVARRKPSPSPTDTGIGMTPESSQATVSRSSSVGRRSYSAAMALDDLPKRAATATPTRASFPRGIRTVTTSGIGGGRGRAQSAYYATNPLEEDEIDNEEGGVSLQNNSVYASAYANGYANGFANGHTSEMERELDPPLWQQHQQQLLHLQPGMAVDKDGNPKWKRLSNWFKKLGTH